MKNFVNSSALIIIEVNEPLKAPDLRYITVGTSDTNETDEQLSSSALAYFKSGKCYQQETVFNVRKVIRFNSNDEYLKYFKFQLADYLASLTEC